MKKGKIFLISGPSGVGKKTILDKIIDKPNLNLIYSISMTTRPARKTEIDGKDYYFVTKDFFLKQITAGNMLEYAVFFNNYYGTPKNYIQQQVEKGKNVVMEIETIGAEQVMKKIPECVSIFILPPSLSELKNRLIKRGTESLDLINLRLKKAVKEIELKTLYQHNIWNIDPDQAAAELEQIIIAAQNV